MYYISYVSGGEHPANFIFMGMIEWESGGRQHGRDTKGEEASSGVAGQASAQFVQFT